MDFVLNISEIWQLCNGKSFCRECEQNLWNVDLADMEYVHEIGDVRKRDPWGISAAFFKNNLQVEEKIYFKDLSF